MPSKKTAPGDDPFEGPTTSMSRPSSERLLAGLSYIGVLFLIPALVSRRNAFIEFHVRQGLVLFILEAVASFFVWIPLFGILVPVVLVGVAIYAFSRAMAGEKWRLPFVADYAEKIRF